MKPAPFTYHRPDTLAQAADLLATLPDAKVLAGGQSLVPALNMRLASVGHLIDLGALTDAGLRDVTVTDDAVVVGALVTHARLAADAGAAGALPLLSDTLAHVAHPAIRNRGTTVGSIVHADPNGEMPSVLALLGGSLDVVSARGSRTIEAADLFVGPMESSLEPDEIAVAARFPRPPAGVAFVDAYDEFARRSGDYAIAGVGVHLEFGGGGGAGGTVGTAVTSARASFVSVTDVPDVLDLTPALAGAAAGEPLAEAVATALGDLVAGHVDPVGDIHADADYRRHLAVVLARRVVERALAAAVTAGATAGATA